MADYYKDIFPAGEKADFLKKEFEEKKSLLDIGCSDGRVAEALSREGFELEAIDLSEDMVRVAKEVSKVGSGFSVSKIDMTEAEDYFLEASLDGIYCVGNTLVHLESLKTIASAIRGFKTLLKKNGKLVIQILNYDFIYGEDIRELPLIENEKIKFKRYYELEDKNVIFTAELLIKESGETFKGSTNLVPLRKNKLEESLKSAGFNSIRYYGGFDRRDFKNNSMTLIAVAQSVREELPSIHC